MHERTYTIDPRPDTKGGGWSLTMFENGEEMGRGVFPPKDDKEDSSKNAYAEAMATGEEWTVQFITP